jgi:type IV secretory pathway TraG/TraD family ATPase VirD4
LDKLEDMLEGYLPPRCVNLYNILQNHFWLRGKLSEGYSSRLRSIPHYARKQPDAISVQKMEGVTDNAEKTRSSYLGVVENHYDAFGQPSMYQLSSNSTLCVEDIVKKPMAVFIQTGSTRVGDTFVSLIVNRLYQYIKERGRRALDKRMPRDIHCFLDEFANIYIADPADYAHMLTDSRKNGMYWHMILQCDAQLDSKYNKDIARIIRANSTELFMGSHDYETEVRFAQSCGQKTIESLYSEIAQQGPSLVSVDLITPDQLNLTEEGYIYIKSNRHPLTKTYIEAFYRCEEFAPVEV